MEDGNETPPHNRRDGMIRFWADRYGKTAQTIRNWCSAGFKPTWTPEEGDRWKQRHKPGGGVKKTKDGAELRDEQTIQLTRKYRHEARLRKIQADLQCGKLVPLDMATSGVSSVAQAARSVLQTMHLDYGADVMELMTVGDGERALRAIAGKLGEKIEEAGAKALEQLADNLADVEVD